MAEIPGISLTAKTIDNKMYVTSTARPLGTTVHFTSVGDSTDNLVAIGGGQKMLIRHHIGDSTAQTIDVNFNVMENSTYIREGCIMWTGCDFDQICLAVLAKATDWTTGTDTYFNIFGGYLIVPAAGDGNIQLTGQPQLVECPISIDTGLRDLGFWNVHWDVETHTFGDMTACPNGDGTYNMFAVELPLSCYAREVALVGSGTHTFNSTDTQEFPHGVILRLSACSDGTADHEWAAGISFSMFREKTI